MTNQSSSPTEALNSQPPNLLLLNAKVLTMAQRQPIAEAVAVQGQNILAVGSHNVLAALAGPKTRTIDCQGMTLLPGFIDAHCHILATAAALQGVDCGPETVSSIQDLQQAVRNRTDEIPPGFGSGDLATTTWP